MHLSEEQYLADCNDFFAPLDEIGEALRNREGLVGCSYEEIIGMVNTNEELKARLKKYMEEFIK